MVGIANVRIGHRLREFPDTANLAHVSNLGSSRVFWPNTVNIVWNGKNVPIKPTSAFFTIYGKQEFSGHTKGQHKFAPCRSLNFGEDFIIEE